MRYFGACDECDLSKESIHLLPLSSAQQLHVSSGKLTTPHTLANSPTDILRFYPDSPYGIKRAVTVHGKSLCVIKKSA